MTHYCSDCDLARSGAIVPEYSIGRGSSLLCIGFKDRFAVWPRERTILVRLHGRMPKIRLHKSKALAYRFQGV
jgi:hypothetical protein